MVQTQDFIFIYLENILSFCCVIFKYFSIAYLTSEIVVVNSYIIKFLKCFIYMDMDFNFHLWEFLSQTFSKSDSPQFTLYI